jgi:vanillate O-demethylase monooxygenase subunit
VSNYPRNCWWVAATSAEVTTTPFQRWLLDTPVALYRTAAGQPVALDDRCPHRWAPLSEGQVDGEIITCPYHGARFEPDGKCVAFPAQKAVPGTMQVRSFPLIERGPYIWIWMGDEAARQAADLPPDYAWSAAPEWTLASDTYELGANYMLLHENLLDLTHFNHVHAKTFQFENWTPSPSFHADGNRVGFENSYAKDDLNEHERMLVGLGYPGAERNVADCWFETPALHQVTSTVFINPESGAPFQYLTRINHMVTPVSATQSHYWWLVGTNEPLPEPIRTGYATMIKSAYLEDKVVLESIQRTLDRDPRGSSYPELSFQSDGGGILARRALERILAAERGG